MPESHESERKEAAKNKRAEKVSKMLVNKSRTIAIVVVSLLLLSASIAIALDLSSKADLKGWEALYKLTQPDTTSGATPEKEATPEDILEVANTYKNSSVEPHALFVAASKFLAPPTDGKTKEMYGMSIPPARVAEALEARTSRLTNAETTLKRLIASFPSHELSPQAKAMLGVVFEEQGNFQKAAETLLALNNEIEADKYANLPNTLKIKIKYDLGRNYYFLGDMVKAKQHIDQAARHDDLIDFSFYSQTRRVPPDWVEKAKYLRTVIGIGEDALELPEKVTPSPTPAPIPTLGQSKIKPLTPRDLAPRPTPGPTPGPAPVNPE